MSLRDALDSNEKAAAIAEQQAENRDNERRRIREKMPDDLREFVDSVRAVFPTARLVAVEFPDGETIGTII